VWCRDDRGIEGAEAFGKQQTRRGIGVSVGERGDEGESGQSIAGERKGS
jgi:hypothetical protein